MMDLTNYDNFLELKLFDGYAYIDVNENFKKGKNTYRRTYFKENLIRFDLSNFNILNNSQKLYKGHYAMLNNKQLKVSIDSLTKEINTKKSEFNSNLNNNYNIQRKSGYSQINLINKINLKLNNDLNVIYGIYYSKSSNVPRYDRLILYEDIFIPSYSEWYYGPNTFLMNSVKLSSFKKSNFFDAFKLNLSHQKVNESRHTRKFNINDIKNRYETVNVLSLNLDFDKKFIF